MWQLWGVESHCSALSGTAFQSRQARAVRTPSGWFSIYAALVLSLETAVNGKRPIKDQDCEVKLVSNKFGITKIITKESLKRALSLQYDSCEKYR